ncbi:MAG: hypothetical protein QOE89_2753 [Pseudonocardiales bacterium]|nr:hypothetical protein [Pseudonocardiales bacterium]
MNDFAYLAAALRTLNTAVDLLELSPRLAQTPGEPLYRSYISPDRLLTTYVDKSASADSHRSSSRPFSRPLTRPDSTYPNESTEVLADPS